MKFLEIKNSKQDKYFNEINERLKEMVWWEIEKSWYKSIKGSVPNNWPGRTMEYTRRTKKVKFEKIGNNAAEAMQRINYLLSQTEQQLKNAIYNSAVISENLRGFSGRIKNSPSQILFGQAPPKLDPGKL